MTSTPIAPVEAVQLMAPEPAQATARPSGQSFSQMMMNGVTQVDQKMKAADAAVTAFALNDSIPPHQVMFALEAAHNAMSMMMQVRARVVEGYQELMRMQL